MFLIAFSLSAQKKKTALPSLQEVDKQTIITNLDKRFDEYAKLSKQIWNFAELGYLEEKSSALLQETLKAEGFKVESGVAGIPTAFLATFGEGSPILGILAEYDALPGLAQEVSPSQTPIPNQKGGHGCGHNLFGTASVAAAIQVKDWLKAGHKGTIKLYGCPAEEGGSAKVYMVREGLFNGVDVVLHWHPAASNGVDANGSLANVNAKFRFKGVASHASVAPEQGRSALDGVEAMDNMVNMMREHIPSDTRIHYVITKGGEAPNVVPANAEVYYYVRNRDRDIVKDVWSRIEKAAQGAAMGTGTTVTWEILGGVFNILPNITLSEMMENNLKMVGGVKYNEEEKAFAEKMLPTLTVKEAVESAAEIKDFRTISNSIMGAGSTDVGDVSWALPTVGMRSATWVPGVPAHSWQAVACSGMSIGQKGMLVSAKTLAISALDLYNNPALIEKAKAEWLEKRGKDFKYEALLGNRKPALDYRK